ncbi:hypothetical protein CK203_005521 [Vitis vinifera]|uniref:Uncharacterized protein n=1 Tax=Vitis vinifera TaxID=29760 RepID=A0A438K3F2_VITVI|nr:hypothetical protein CK203_005521 [Vitis vinifera]
MGNDKYRSPTSTMKAKVEEQEEFRGRKALDSSDGPSTQQLAEFSRNQTGFIIRFCMHGDSFRIAEKIGFFN